MFNICRTVNRIFSATVVYSLFSMSTAFAYRFEIIAEPGDIIEGRTITHFSPEDNPIAINDNREVVFMASVDGLSNYGIMTPERFIAGAGKVVDGVVPSFFDEDHRLSMNDTGQVVYKGILDDSVGEVFGGGAIFVNDEIVAGIGDLIDGRTITSVEIRPVNNNDGTVAFVATYEGHDNSALFTQHELVAERGFPVDESRVLEGGIFLPQIHDDGTIAFSGGIAGQNNVLILTQDGLLVESGETIPGSSFIVNDVIDGRIIAGDIKSFGISDAGEVAFWAIISSADGSVLGQGLFTQNRLLVESGDELDGHIVSSIFGGGRQFNNSGTFSLIADIVDIGEGLWVGNELALASGHTIDGRIVDELHHIVGLNDRGDVALLVRFTDGDSAIVMGIVPEPSTLFLSLIGFVVFGVRVVLISRNYHRPQIHNSPRRLQP